VLLLLVFTAVNIAALVLRKTPVSHEHFRAPWVMPVLGAMTCPALAFWLIRNDTGILAEPPRSR
jgi:hypothetical protein